MGVKADKCPHCIRVCENGIKCKLHHSGNFLMDFATIENFGIRTFRLWTDDSRNFASIVCKGNYKECRLFTKNLSV